MKLNLYTIEHELGGIVAGASLHSDCNAPKADYPILFGVGDHRYYDNIVYVAASRHLEESKDKIKRYLSQNPGLTFSCVCIGTPPAFCLEAKNCDVVWTDGQESRSRTFNAVQRVFQHFNAWERELGAVIDRGGELADLVNASLKVFRNDLCITDPFSRVLVHRVFRHERFTREQTDLIKEGECLPQNMVFDGIEDEREGQDFASFAPTFPVMKAFDCTVLRSVVSVSRDYALILSVHPNYQPVGKKDCAPALVLAEALKRLSAAFARMEGGEHYISVHSTATDATGKSAIDRKAMLRGMNAVATKKNEPARKALELVNMTCLRFSSTIFFDQTSSKAELPMPLAAQSTRHQTRPIPCGNRPTTHPHGQNARATPRSTVSPLRDAKKRAKKPNATYATNMATVMAMRTMWMERSPSVPAGNSEGLQNRQKIHPR